VLGRSNEQYNVQHTQCKAWARDTEILDLDGTEILNSRDPDIGLTSKDETEM